MRHEFPPRFQCRTEGSGTVEPPDITFVETYSCPRCHAELEARISESYTWLRCPKCGRASLPPETTARTPVREREPAAAGIFVIGPGSDLRGLNHAEQERAGAHPGSARRIALAVGFLLAVGALVVSFIEQNVTNVLIFGIATLGLFGFAMVMARRR